MRSVICIDTQSKVLRLLESGEYESVGGVQKKYTDIRIISATHKNLKKEIEKNNFREDLYYRLSTVILNLMPLRDRKDDLPVLVEYFIDKICTEENIKHKTIASKALDLLMNYNWSGNIRELKSVIERAIILSNGDEIQGADICIDTIHDKPTDMHELNGALSEARDKFEKHYIEQALARFNFNIPKTAEYLDIHRVGLYQKIKKYGIIQQTSDHRHQIVGTEQCSVQIKNSKFKIEESKTVEANPCVCPPDAENTGYSALSPEKNNE